MDKVSIIIPVYNNSKHIKQCIDSVINQTYKNLEIIVVDDKSTDNSIDIIKKIKDKRIKVIKLKKNSGVAKARNKGVLLATGDYICYLDSDDYWYSDKIEKQLKLMKENDYTFVYGDYTYLKNGKMHDVHVPKSITYNEALKNTTIFTSTVMFNMKHLNKKDIYMPIVKRGQDTLCWWNVLKKGITAFAVNEVLVVYRIEGKSLSSNKFKALKRTWNIYKMEDLGFFKRRYCYLCYIKNAIKRRI